jgi:hypothetical protein
MELGNSRVVRSAALVVTTAVVVAAAVWLFATRDGERGGSGDRHRLSSQAMTVEELGEFAGAQPETVYWAGERPDTVYEVTRTKSGNVFVRYLDEGADVADPRPNFLTVGTYPVRDAYGLTTEISQREDAVTGRAKDGTLVVTTEERPQSVYMAYRQSDLQIEIYDPDAEQAMRLATSGRVRPIR